MDAIEAHIEGVRKMPKVNEPGAKCPACVSKASNLLSLFDRLGGRGGEIGRLSYLCDEGCEKHVEDQAKRAFFAVVGAWLNDQSGMQDSTDQLGTICARLSETRGATTTSLEVFIVHAVMLGRSSEDDQAAEADEAREQLQKSIKRLRKLHASKKGGQS